MGNTTAMRKQPPIPRMRRISTVLATPVTQHALSQASGVSELTAASHECACRQFADEYGSLSHTKAVVEPLVQQAGERQQWDARQVVHLRQR